ncbi:MAG: ZIP family metal transporter [Candidatus Methanogranum gryphiswaldense]|nr:MAG: ZIP family metal transporter [Candidatus Methanogranum sp. U3.2.1]
MEQTVTFAIFIVAILIVSLVAALLPLMIKISDKQAHLLIAFSAGIFTGVLFLILMPEAIEESLDSGYSAQTIMYSLMAGFVAVFISDIILKHYYKTECACETCMDLHSHDITSMSAFIGLSIHACFDGLAIASAFVIGTEIGGMVIIAMCIHKVVEVFSLSSTFLMSNKKKQAKKYLTTFCFITPLAAVASYIFLDGISLEWTGIALAISAGIFMFVTVCDIIPEAFHRKKYDLESLGLMMIGIAVVIAVVIFATMAGVDF